VNEILIQIIEAPIFTKKIGAFVSFESYRELQLKLIVDPKLGKIIPGSHGIRKLRWPSTGQGKRGGIRIIYYWYGKEYIIYMITAYKKSEKDDLTKEQLKQIVKSVTEDLL